MLLHGFLSLLLSARVPHLLQEPRLLILIFLLLLRYLKFLLLFCIDDQLLKTKQHLHLLFVHLHFDNVPKDQQFVEVVTEPHSGKHFSSSSLDRARTLIHSDALDAALPHSLLHIGEHSLQFRHRILILLLLLQKFLISLPLNHASNMLLNQHTGIVDLTLHVVPLICHLLHLSYSRAHERFILLHLQLYKFAILF